MAQTTAHRQLGSLCFGRGRFVVLSLLIALACALFAACALPGHAFAKEYRIDKVDITVDAQSDASLHIVEQRTITLSGAFTYLDWNLRSANATVNSVQVGTVGESGDTTLSDLPQTGFNLQWREDERPFGSDDSSVGPGTDAYSVDTGRNELYAFFNAQDEQVVVQVDYTVKNGTTAYRDCADLYWQYIGSDWKADSNDVTCTVSLPVPAGVQPTVGDMIYAWGHGPKDGTVTFNEANTVVTYHADRVPKGGIAEVRVVFPRSWLANISADAFKANGSVMFKDQIITAERKWADGASWQQHYAYLYLIVVGGVSAVLLAYALVLLVRFGKRQKGTFTGDVWRDEPHRGVHPAVIGRLYRANRHSMRDFTATVVHLANAGALTVSKGSYKSDRGGQVRGYYLNRVPGAAERLDNAIDRETIALLFDTVAGGRDALWADTLAAFGANHPARYNDAFARWQKALSSVVVSADYFDAKALRRQRVLAVTGVLYFLFSLLLAWFTGNYPPLAFMLPTAVLVFAASNCMPRLTRQGENDLARCRALETWLRDFAAGENDAAAASFGKEKWRDLLVYAYEFGVAEEVVRELRRVAPALFETDDDAQDASWSVPWYGFYEPEDAGGACDGAPAPAARVSADDAVEDAAEGSEGVAAPQRGETASVAEGRTDAKLSRLPSFTASLDTELAHAQRIVDRAVESDDPRMRTDEPDTVPGA